MIGKTAKQALEESGFYIPEDVKVSFQVSGDQLIKVMTAFAQAKCKETARNVRHMATEICAASHSDKSINPERDIMNIQFEDVKPIF